MIILKITYALLTVLTVGYISYLYNYLFYSLNTKPDQKIIKIYRVFLAPVIFGFIYFTNLLISPKVFSFKTLWFVLAITTLINISVCLTSFFYRKVHHNDSSLDNKDHLYLFIPSTVYFGVYFIGSSINYIFTMSF